MNTGPADTRTPHLDLEDLIAAVTGQPVTARAREHLARCEHCGAEARRWDLVGAGVRGLAAGTPPAAPPARQPARPRLLASRGRRTVLAASAAAALVVIAGVGYGVTAAVTRHSPAAVLTAVTGCSGVTLGAGTAERVTGTGLVLKTASGKPVTVTTTPATQVTVAGPLRSDITDGASVVVLGRSSSGTVAAASVTVAASLRGLSLTPPPGWVVARGTVSDTGAAGFTVTTAAGTPVPVRTSRNTFVVLQQGRLSQLQPGVTTVVAGHAGAGTTLAAVKILQQQAMPQTSGPQFQVHLQVQVHGCSPASLADALARVLPAGS
jgi:hypothetical protein